MDFNPMTFMNDFSVISKYRSELMGVATLFVMLFHFRANMAEAPLDFLSSIGYGGVDIFLFLSGFGLFCGYKNNKKLKFFYYKRFIRIYPIYLFIIVVSSLLKGECNVVNILIESLGIGYFLPFLSCPFYDWYVPTILVLYAIFPVIYFFLEKNVLKYGFIMISMGLLMTFFLIFIQKGTIILTTSRIPIFIIGCMFGYGYVKNNHLKNIPLLICMSLITILIEIILVNHYDNDFLWRNAIYWLPFIIIVPGLCLFLSYCFYFFAIGKSNIFKWIGKLSYEAYLIHVLFLGVYREWCVDFIQGSVVRLWLAFLIFCVIVFVISFFIHKMYRKLIII